MTTLDPYTTAQAFVLESEGGFSNDPRDPGGATNLGVTRMSWATWLGRPVSIAEIRALTPDAVSPFYKATFWRPINGDKLPPALALLVYQFAVNAGIKRAAEFLQEIIGAKQDGDIGPATLVAVRNKVAATSISVVCAAYATQLRTYYRAEPNFATFGQGWLNRVGAACDAAQKLY